MIAIGNVLVSDDVIQEKFVCDLSKCKGGCCEDGDAGASLEKSEMELLKKEFDKVKPYLTPEGITEIERTGRYQYDREFGWVTPTINGKMCVYGFRDKQGVIKCGIEKAHAEGKISWNKPISCHLFPIRTSFNKKEKLEYVNYEPREVLCSPACALGKKLKVPVYQFLRESIIRKYGAEFYEALEAVAKHKQQAK